MESELNYDKLGGLIPCVVQDADTHKVLMLGFMNAEALAKTREESKVTFYSRSRMQLWTKGETSGNYLNVVDIRSDCDMDCLLIRVHPQGPVCHNGTDTCFGEENSDTSLGFLERIIKDRQAHPDDDSYTSRLLSGGINRIAQKVGEEAVELVIEARDGEREKFLNEAADLVYHLEVLLAARECRFIDVVKVLAERNRR